MAKLDLLIHAWDEGHREFQIALEGLSDEDLWKRPHPKLLSVGEIAGHHAYWEADKTTGHLPEESRTSGPLVDPAFRYYAEEQLAKPVVLEISVEEVSKEMRRVHEEGKKAVIELDPDFADRLQADKAWPTWGFYLQYMGFHIAYHTGQIYSVRHLLGHTTTDN